MPVNVQLRMGKTTGWIGIGITKNHAGSSDGRRGGSRYEWLEQREALALIRKVASALERIQIGSAGNATLNRLIRKQRQKARGTG